VSSQWLEPKGALGLTVVQRVLTQLCRWCGALGMLQADRIDDSSKLTCIRSIIGPMIGGALARPCISYPEIFSKGSIWDRYPYLLPNLFSAATVFVGVIIGLLFLEETHAVKKHQRDRCREVGDYVSSLFCKAGSCQGRSRSPEKQSLLENDSLIGYRTTGSLATDDANSNDSLPAYQSRDNSPRLSPQARPRSTMLNPSQESNVNRPSKIFTKPVVLNIVSYGILALYVHTLTCRAGFRPLTAAAIP
jgi:hypothetical protein